jgi:hypothetical protein
MNHKGFGRKQSLPDTCTIPEFACGETAKNHEKSSVWVTRTTTYLDRYFIVELSPSREMPS